MPLLKLWNALRGRRPAAAAADPAPETPASSAGAQAAVPASVVKAEPPAKRSASAKPAGGRGVLGMPRRDPHRALCKLIRPLRPATILEISVGDGSRAVAVLQTLAKAQPETPPRYVAIDQFELAGGPVTLKQFHQRLRQENVRPQVFPDAVDQALLRVAYTVGAIDLILIADPSAEWDAPQRQQLLGRVTHGDSVVMRFDGEQWRRERVGGSVSRAASRRAAA